MDSAARHPPSLSPRESPQESFEESTQAQHEIMAAANEPRFVHLHAHSSYSLLEGALTIQRLAELAKKDRQPALALTDTDNMFGALEFSDKMAGYGIQPIVGCELAVDFGDQDPSASRNAMASAPAVRGDRSVGLARARLPQPDATSILPRVPGNAGSPDPAHQVPRVAGGSGL